MTTEIKAGSPSVPSPTAVHPPLIRLKQKCEQYGLITGGHARRYT